MLNVLAAALQRKWHAIVFVEKIPMKYGSRGGAAETHGGDNDPHLRQRRPPAPDGSLRLDNEQGKKTREEGRIPE
jgi:hypothetical protein